jgi:hypothetical protein
VIFVADRAVAYPLWFRSLKLSMWMSNGYLSNLVSKSFLYLSSTVGKFWLYASIFLHFAFLGEQT